MSWREALRGREREIAGKRLTVGFDGFADTIVRPLRQPDAPGVPAAPFATIREFGEFLTSKAEKSCSVELSVEARQLGGNLPFLSRAAGGLGLDVTCIGMLGELGSIDPLFAQMPCRLHSFAPPGQSTCMEFNDGKLLFSSDCIVPGDAWDAVCTAVKDDVPTMFREADLIALVNWSELSFAHGLWEHVCDAVAEGPADKRKFAFFDLCDVSRRTDSELEAVLRLIGRFAQSRTAVLSLNENEALGVSERLLSGPDDPSEIAAAVCRHFGIDEVIVHTIHESVLSSVRGTVRRPSDFVAHPRISTGAGDNFNGASCLAAVMGLDDNDRLAFANAFANFYISQGRSPSMAELMAASSDG